ncbi:MAG: ATP-binding protein, partial [Clostridia bacterium]|nr:ATP-binding protein [Clostridia bacterium]
MERKFTEKLNHWKNEYINTPLMLIGARQTGKTYIIKKFCEENFEHHIYINFDENDIYESFFQESLNAEDIIYKISTFLGYKIDIDKTIIFFDEIQKSERAINSLKYFCESDKPYKIICAGSLLGVKINRYHSSFPVGKVRIEYLYPLDFEEFLWALGENLLSDEIHRCYEKLEPMNQALHEKALNLYKIFLCTGGMPASLNELLHRNKDILFYQTDVKENILTAYIADMSKYTSSAEAIKIREIYKSIPKQLGKENQKFQYKVISSNARSRDYESSIEWLIQSGIILECNLAKIPKIPLEIFKESKIFKLYLSDCGLLMNLAKITITSMLNDVDMLYKGMIAENFVAQTFKSKGYSLYYYESNSKSEIDFLLTLEDEVIPVEVKASNNTTSKSLSAYMTKYSPKYAIRISSKNFGY